MDFLTSKGFFSSFLMKNIKFHIVTNIKITKRENNKSRPKPNTQLSNLVPKTIPTTWSIYFLSHSALYQVILHPRCSCITVIVTLFRCKRNNTTDDDFDFTLIYFIEQEHC